MFALLLRRDTKYHAAIDIYNIENDILCMIAQGYSSKPAPSESPIAIIVIARKSRVTRKTYGAKEVLKPSLSSKA